jgi:flagellar M-ring protein FliF
MAFSDYWNALSARQRSGLIGGAVLIAVTTTVLVVWLLRDPYVPLAGGLDANRLDGVVKMLERAGLEYRVDDRGDTVSVPRSQLGKAHAAAAGDSFDTPPSVGLELFKETDFSSTDFAQRVNYQRALQGELTRTIQTISGVRSARVHVILPDSSLFKRDAAKATAAVSVTTQPNKVLAHAQVIGIQRLVAASVPQIKIDDVVVLDESGASLTRPGGESEGELTSVQMDLKRQADQYFEAKVTRLLQELMPKGVTSLAVDATLDEKQLRVTTEEPVAARGQQSASNHVAGVLIKERQSKRGRAPGLMETDGYAGDGDSTDWEYEYKVGNRVEQTLSAPGSIKRISVAVAMRGAPAGLSAAAIEELVGHAVGADHERGDSVSVLLLPGADAAGDVAGDALPSASRPRNGIASPAADGESRGAQPGENGPSSAGMSGPASDANSDANSDPASDPASDPNSGGTAGLSSHVTSGEFAWLIAIATGAVIAVILLWVWLGRRRSIPVSTLDDAAVAAKVRQWLAQGEGDGRA